MARGSAISLFSGAGGLDLGAEAAGFRTVAAVEWDDDAADTMEKNRLTYFPELREVVRADLYPLATGDGTGINTRGILRAGGLGPRERPDLLIGGPPCVAFSKSGFWLDWKREGVDPAASLQARNVDLVVLDQGIDTSTAIGRMFFQILGAIAEFEHALMSERTRDGLEAARARGRTGGQRPKLTARQAKIAQDMYDEIGPDGHRTHTVQQIADEFGVTRPTIYRHLQPRTDRPAHR